MTSKKADEGRTFEEPSPPALLNPDGLDKLVRVSHLTQVATKLSKQYNQPSYLLDMTRVRDLNLDVLEEELPMLKNILRKQNASCIQEKWSQQGLSLDNTEESPPTPGSPTLPSYLLPRKSPTMDSAEKVQPEIPTSEITLVNTDAVKVTKAFWDPKKVRTSMSEDDTSPVIKAKIPKRACRSQELSRLEGN